MGASPIAGNDPPLDPSGGHEPFEGSVTQDDAVWQQQIRARELADGLPASASPPAEAWSAPAYREAPATYDRPVYVTEPADISDLPDRFALEIERKPDGMWKVTAPGVHVGLFVADRDLSSALAEAPGVLAEIVRLDGVVAKPRERKRMVK
jgi:hypothetical protein